MRRYSWAIFVVVLAAIVAGAISLIFESGPDAPPLPESSRGLDHRPALHAMLNATSGLLLAIGFLFIRAGRVRLHLTCMILATLVTLGFLSSYLQYHYQVGSVSFEGGGWVRAVYLAMLISHAGLAAFVHSYQLYYLSCNS